MKTNEFIKKLLLCFTVLLFVYGKSQFVFSGKIINDERQKQSGIQIHNMRTGSSVLSDYDGGFSIDAHVGDEIRLISSQFLRTNIVLKEEHFKNPQTIKLDPFVKEIAGVQLDKISMKDRVTEMQNKIGLPPPPKKPREVPPPTVKQVGAIKYLLSNRNLNNLYKNLSGDARRMRSLYHYEDAEEKLGWIRESVGNNFFEENSIPKDKQTEFIHFVMGKEELHIPIKEKNIDAVKFALSRYAQDFIKLIEKQNS
ncbi:hypothetical protein OZ664_10825 [Elizabethkingia sp. HX WHF]|uniref:hypothetical protein n=1 Tax=Elizabethkingia TaxID=308865 RepID=UPI00099A669B|nr:MULTISPECIES: hypothetical protein [Elizabethkingia]ATL43440.1 hypothetical protein CQS02_09070 [Elizabethkingia miricola]MCL1638476.1 hypothetical protein [Elizabethkingia bruuniana]MDX8564495.1 hypothetical protein [Elizabethkingia sp. HX WHF]OPC26284.1 hypothetical protein BAY00_02970 [Elizabethkingia bruuniana]